MKHATGGKHKREGVGSHGSKRKANTQEKRRRFAWQMRDWKLEAFYVRTSKGESGERGKD
ncbi:ATP-dependent protease, ATPase subunit [Eggerthella sp. YY7918]|nr:ATP-dependent protease, ATPase subunit [Eggerthella sp. YY7918]